MTPLGGTKKVCYTDEMVIKLGAQMYNNVECSIGPFPINLSIGGKGIVNFLNTKLSLLKNLGGLVAYVRSCMDFLLK